MWRIRHRGGSPAVMNAIADALQDYPAAAGIQMPARPTVIWKAIHEGG
ncbi:hypothetical protein I546_2493 [Mycobacterium kansasii 732]|nr:hypothetical protein I546_2493 [Mycobacterium kansasii 732]